MAVRKTKAGLALKLWCKEKWLTATGKKGSSKGDIIFSPTSRIGNKTPLTWSELKPAEKARA